MNPWPPSSSSSSFHPSSAAPSSPGYQPPHLQQHPRPQPPPVASSSHHHHHPHVPPTTLDSEDIQDIKKAFSDLAIAAPNVCKWINPPLRGIDDTVESASMLEMRQHLPGPACGRILASGNILLQHVTAHINALKGIRIDRKQKSKQKTYECLWSGCQVPRFTSREALVRHATDAHVKAHRPCPFLKCPSTSTTLLTLDNIVPHVKAHHLGPDESLSIYRRDFKFVHPPAHELRALPPLPHSVPRDRIAVGYGAGTPVVASGRRIVPKKKKKLGAVEEEAARLERELEEGIWRGMEALDPTDDEEDEEEELVGAKGKGKGKQREEKEESASSRKRTRTTSSNHISASSASSTPAASRRINRKLGPLASATSLVATSSMGTIIPDSNPPSPERDPLDFDPTPYMDPSPPPQPLPPLLLALDPKGKRRADFQPHPSHLQDGTAVPPFTPTDSGGSLSPPPPPPPTAAQQSPPPPRSSFESTNPSGSQPYFLPNILPGSSSSKTRRLPSPPPPVPVPNLSFRHPPHHFIKPIPPKSINPLSLTRLPSASSSLHASSLRLPIVGTHVPTFLTTPWPGPPRPQPLNLGIEPQPLPVQWSHRYADVEVEYGHVVEELVVRDKKKRKRKEERIEERVKVEIDEEERQRLLGEMDEDIFRDFLDEIMERSAAGNGGGDGGGEGEGEGAMLVE